MLVEILADIYTMIQVTYISLLKKISYRFKKIIQEYDYDKPVNLVYP